MVKFSRSWRLLQLLFPGAFEGGTPQAINPDIQPVWDAFRLAPGECLLRSSRITDTAPGAGAAVTMTFEAPVRGRAQVPMTLTALHNNAATQRVDCFINQVTGQTAEPHGAWVTSSTPLQVGSINIAEAPVGAGQGGAARIATIPFLTFSNQIQAIWRAPTAGAALIVDYMWLDVPIEILSVLPFNHHG